MGSISISQLKNYLKKRHSQVHSLIYSYSFLDLMGAISQMPVILIPIHFDRDPIVKQPSCQRSVVIRTFITNDFMTGVPAQPEKHLPESVSHYYFKCKRVAAFRSIPLQSTIYFCIL